MSGEIVLVGPTLPFRGGIAHYNTALFRALRDSGQSDAGFSFSRQYPKWLYPGQSDLDPALGDHREPGVVYSIDSMNPLTWVRTARAIAERKPELVVFHWWTVFWLPCFRTMMWLLKRSGIRSALICHNLTDHDAGGIKAAASRYLLACADAFLVHSSEHARVLGSAHPDKPVVQHPIPVYGHYPPAKGTLPKRGRLELLFFGFIRPYKGLDLLIDALAGLGDSQVFLTVVGEHWGDSQELVQQAGRAPNVELHLTYTSDDEAAEYFARADLVVLPYRTATGSAVASLAIAYGKPILATTAGGLPDVVTDGANGYLVPPGDSAAIGRVIARISREQLATMTQATQRVREGMSWSSLASGLQKLAANPGNGRGHD